MDKYNYKITCRIFKETKCFGPGIAELLEKVKETNSLRQAALSMNMAYSKAWGIIKQSEEALGFKLLISTTGGKGGGSAKLTDEAQKFLANYNTFQTELKAYGDQLFLNIFNVKE